MTVSFRSLGSGQVAYRPDRRIIHFATPPAEAQARIAEDRLRARGFILNREDEEE